MQPRSAVTGRRRRVKRPRRQLWSRGADRLTRRAVNLQPGTPSRAGLPPPPREVPPAGACEGPVLSRIRTDHGFRARAHRERYPVRRPGWRLRSVGQPRRRKAERLPLLLRQRVTGILAVGLLPVVFQWLVLRRRVHRAGRWVWGAGATFFLAAVAAFAVVRWGLVIGWLRLQDSPSAKSFVLFGVLIGLLYGAVSGALLVRLLGRSLSEPVEQERSEVQSKGSVEEELEPLGCLDAWVRFRIERLRPGPGGPRVKAAGPTSASQHRARSW